MIAYRRKGLAAAAISAAVVLSLFGCGKEPKPEIAETPNEIRDGDSTVKTDPSAPKKIESKDLTGFEADFCVETRWNSEEDNFFDFAVKKDEGGSLTASENILGVSCPADEELMAALQAVIDKYDLVKLNGVYETNYSLSPEYQKCHLKADYVSGECLEFTDLNDPTAEWAEEIYDILAAHFSANGEEAVYPAKEDSLIEGLTLEYVENGQRIRYSRVNVLDGDAIDGKTHLFGRRISDAETYEDISEDYILIPDDLYERVTEIIAATDLVRRYDFSRYDHLAGNLGNHDEGYFGMGNMTTKDGEPDAEDQYLYLYIEFESGKRMNIETQKASEIEGMRPIVEALTAYYDSLF